MEVKAAVKYIRVSPQKARLVADTVRGKAVSDALSILEYTPKAVSRYIYKLISSAVANASSRDDMDVDTLFVKTIFVDQGPYIKEIQSSCNG